MKKEDGYYLLSRTGFLKRHVLLQKETWPETKRNFAITNCNTSFGELLVVHLERKPVAGLSILDLGRG
jgi:hypothetical protein